MATKARLRACWRFTTSVLSLAPAGLQRRERHGSLPRRRRRGCRVRRRQPHPGFDVRQVPRRRPQGAPNSSEAGPAVGSSAAALSNSTCRSSTAPGSMPLTANSAGSSWRGDLRIVPPCRSGKVNLKFEPTPLRPHACNQPLCSLVSSAAMDRPRPLPRLSWRGRGRPARSGRTHGPPLWGSSRFRGHGLRWPQHPGWLQRKCGPAGLPRARGRSVPGSEGYGRCASSPFPR